ncbi:MAG: FAD-binding protein, partial [Defluviitaleaceae bacterium]|nr:FAD-binding protein [Defluviitaleaceae bacterium]
LALPVLKANVLAHQSANIDVVAGSTISSLGFILAVDQALQQAEAPTHMRFAGGPVYQPRAITSDIDILVMGTGLSGLTAAIKAKTEAPDANVVLIDKSQITGGTSRMAAPVFWLPHDDTQQSRDNFLEFYYHMAQGDADRTILRAFADNVRSAYRLIINNSNIPAGEFIAGFSTHQWIRWPARDHWAGPGTTPGNRMIDALVERAIGYGIPILTGVEGFQLIVDPANPARVIGAYARSRTNITYTFNTSAGVILATGGHGWNRDMIDTYHAGLHIDRPYNHPTHTGDGYRMGRDIGARTLITGGRIGTSAVYGTIPIVRDVVGVPIANDGELIRWGTQNPIPARAAGYVNMFGYSPPNGLLAQFDAASNAHLAATTQLIRRCQRTHLVYLNAKRAEARAAGLPDPTFYMLRWIAAVPRHPGNPIIYYGTSVEELINAFPAGMRDTMRAGIVDAFAPSTAPGDGRPFAPGAGAYLIATRIHGSDIGTIGGLMIDTNAQVLREAGGTFTGLYAVGDLANGQFLYQNYISGTALSIGTFTGFMAGAHIAEQFNN